MSLNERNGKERETNEGYLLENRESRNSSLNISVCNSKSKSSSSGILLDHEWKSGTLKTVFKIKRSRAFHHRNQNFTITAA